MSLSYSIVKAPALSGPQIETLYAMYNKYYSGSSPEQFKEDLSEKTHVFLLMDGKIVIGFSTILLLKMGKDGWRPRIFLYSGDTVIERDYWGQKILQKAFFRFIVLTKLRYPLFPVYWMLISKGYKTYMMMQRNFSNSFPAEGRVTPAPFRRAALDFYKRKFGDAYDDSTNLITFRKSKGAVRPEYLEKPVEQSANVSFFFKANPDHHLGVELACVAKIGFSDFFGHVPKYFVKFTRRQKQNVFKFKLGSSQ